MINNGNSKKIIKKIRIKSRLIIILKSNVLVTNSKVGVGEDDVIGGESVTAHLGNLNDNGPQK